MKRGLATLGASLAIGLAGCDNAPDTKTVEAQTPAITASAPVNKVINTASIKVNDACNYDTQPSESAIIANREQKEFWIKAHQELNRALSKYRYVPNGDKPESDGTKYYKGGKKDVVIVKTDSKSKGYEGVYYDVTIKLPNPVTVQGRQYTEVYLNVTPDASFSLTKFQNSGDTFPKLRFGHSDGKKDNPDVLCLTSRYYDDVEGIRLTDNGSLGKPVPYSQENFDNLVKIALEKLKS